MNKKGNQDAAGGGAACPTLQAFELGLAHEKKAFESQDTALLGITDDYARLCAVSSSRTSQAV